MGCRTSKNPFIGYCCYDMWSKEFSLTTGGWTSRANHSYITHTIHYIDESGYLQPHILDTAEMSLEHTDINLAD